MTQVTRKGVGDMKPRQQMRDWRAFSRARAWSCHTDGFGCHSYTQAEAIAIMLNPTRGDMTYQLAAQLAAAKLNVDCARMDSSCVASALAAADGRAVLN